MKISKENYEIFFIDYIDGILSDRQIAELEEFLLIHPDLREELEGMEKAIIVPYDLTFTDKDILKKIDTHSALSDDNFNDYTVAYIEGDLTHKESEAFEAYLDLHPNYKNDVDLYKKTFLTPDHSIIFHNKKELIKRSPAENRIYLYSVISVAAAIAMLFIIFSKNNRSDIVTIPLAGNSETIETKIESHEGKIVKTPDYALAEKVKKEIKPVIKPKQSETIDYMYEKEETADHILLSETENFVVSNSPVTLPYVNLVNVPHDKIQGIASNPKTIIDTEKRYMSLSEIALKYVNDKVLKPETPITDSSKITFWDVADASVRGINHITGSEMKLDKVTGEDGEIVAVNFDAGFFGFRRTIR